MVRCGRRTIAAVDERLGVRNFVLGLADRRGTMHPGSGQRQGCADLRCVLTAVTLMYRSVLSTLMYWTSAHLMWASVLLSC